MRLSFIYVLSEERAKHLINDDGRRFAGVYNWRSKHLLARASEYAGYSYSMPTKNAGRMDDAHLSIGGVWSCQNVHFDSLQNLFRISSSRQIRIACIGCCNVLWMNLHGLSDMAHSNSFIFKWMWANPYDGWKRGDEKSRKLNGEFKLLNMVPDSLYDLIWMGVSQPNQINTQYNKFKFLLIPLWLITAFFSHHMGSPTFIWRWMNSNAPYHSNHVESSKQHSSSLCKQSLFVSKSRYKITFADCRIVDICTCRSTDKLPIAKWDPSDSFQLLIRHRRRHPSIRLAKSRRCFLCHC